MNVVILCSRILEERKCLEGKTLSLTCPVQIAYRGYWQRVLLSCLQKNSSLSVKDLVELTGIRQQDVHEVLEKLGILKYWRGEHVMHPQGKLIDDILESLDKKKSIAIDVSRLHWTPFSSVQQVLPVT